MGVLSGYPHVRATEDLDLFIRATAANVERLKRGFRLVHDNDPNIDDISADDLLGEYPAVRYCPPSGDSVHPLDHQDAEALKQQFDLGED